METREDRLSSLRMLSSLSRHASSRAIAIRATIFVKIVIFTRQDWKLPRYSYPACINYHHSTRLERKITFGNFSLLKIEFLETGGNSRNSALSSREERAWAIWSVPDCTRRRRRATLSNHFPRIIPDNPRQIVTYLEQFRSPSLAKLLRWGDEYCFLTVSSIRYNSRPRGIAPSAR